ncbi:MAG: hypothetical protein JW860_14610 [Sedimentisphaerales bacterium]|nr:hypothetical protein [Sedimentisphaerales bacterium]
MINGKQIHSYRFIAMAIFTFCLILPQAAMAATANIDLSTPRQTIRGFGGMNFPRWIGTLTNDQVDTAFGNGPGQIGFTILRIDVPHNNANWSGEISAAVRAKSHGAIVVASPWSPPASMKTNNDLIGGELRTDAYDDYADHLTDFANYMSSNGASLYAISLQNEPDIAVSYESCDWTSTQMRNFLTNNASVIPTRVMVAESFNFNQSFTDPILNDSAAEAQMEIIAGHIYGGGLSDYPLARNKGKDIFMTEHLVLETDWVDNLATGKEIHDCMVANMNAYIWWYIRRSYGPMDEDGNVTKRGYVMSHFAKFVRPGYTRVDATASPSSGVYVTAYKSGDSLVIVAINQNSSSSSVTFSLSGGSVDSYTKYETTSDNNLSNMGSVGSTNTLAANSINTFVGTIGGGETTPPTPDPMQWASGGEPAATGSTSIIMTAETASDDSPPVSYYFECTTDGSASSTWQTSLTYEAQDLTPSTSYTFRVRARDDSPAQNETEWSGTASATTDPPSTDVELVTPWQTGLTNEKPSATNRALIFVAHGEMDGVMDLTDVTYGGQSMNKVVEGNYSATIEAYVAAYILDEAGITAATNDTFNPTWDTEPAEIKYASVFLSNVNQADLTGDSATAGGTSSTILTSSLTTNNGDMVIDAATCGNTGTYTLNNGFTQGSHQSSASSTGVTGYKSATAIDETPSVTHNSVNRQVIIGFVVQAAEANGFENCSQVQSGGYRLASDLNEDCYVNLGDLEVLTYYWLDTDCSEPDNCEHSDFEPDSDVDFADFSDFAMQWMQCNNPTDSGCTPNW